MCQIDICTPLHAFIYPSFGTFNISFLFFRLANFSSMHGLQYILGKEYDGMEAARNKALKGESLIPMQV